MMNKNKGFTLIELMIALAIFGILLGVAVPSFTALMNDKNMISQMTKLTAVIAYARSEAVTRSVAVVVCSSTDGATCAGNNTWEQGWIVFTDLNGNGAPDLGGGNCAATVDCLLNVQGAMPAGVTLRATAASIVYTPTGDPAGGGGTAFRLCGASAQANNDTDYSRTVTISAPGSASVVKGAATCP
ncbi:prepilin-type N-terminal cleavage/methylation domain-containing protein [Exilibacterium tricleocarpae]|uniref:Type II secretion system protein H n=1 Tax=Exilibacterium tricleocarpae TaxID=2591008 RepID=A0A545T1Z5_9GAMM|nr:GspH/FimT family pseudopilin [Exilibacterium tricleocarpae]TQV71219.1 prepilin-type N-terminal cleavage/methylation domain-containing protein [Exilibacterium tricleocarpae]